MPRTAALHAYKGLQDWIEIFQSGTHVDSQGNERTFTDADLDQMVANTALYAAPAVLGHPKDDDPAYARVKDIKREGASLFAKFGDIDPEFQKAVDDGRYRERSVSIFKDKVHGWMVKHVGWLGAVPPALKGMAALKYSAPAADESFDFAMAGDDMCRDISYALNSAAQLLRGLRDWVISKDGLDTANSVLPDWAITSINDTAQRIRDSAMADDASPFSQPAGASMSFTQEDLNRAAEEAAARARTEAQAQFAQAQQQLQQLQTERQTERINTQIEGWRAKGLVLPAEEPGLAEFMAALESGAAAEFTFSQGDGKTAGKKTPAAWFHDFVASRKPLVQLGKRSADPEGDSTDEPSDKEIADRARNYMQAQSGKGIRISIGAAIDAVKAGKDQA